jgi:hypothetical protein
MSATTERRTGVDGINISEKFGAQGRRLSSPTLIGDISSGLETFLAYYTLISLEFGMILAYEGPKCGVTLQDVQLGTLHDR